MKPVFHPGRLPRLAALSLALIAAAGCNRDQVKTYQVDPSDVVVPPPPAAAPGMPMGMSGTLPAPDNAGLPKLSYALPEGWKEKAPSQLRVASFEVSADGKTADISVVPLGAMSGGDLANVNRWLGQIGQPAASETDLAKLAEPVEISGKPATLYDLAGTTRIIGAILHGDDAVWFFKMTGDVALVENQKAHFIAFLKSVTFGPAGAPTGIDPSALPPSHPAIPGMPAAGQPNPATAAGDKPVWTVPAGWQEGQLAQFLVAKFIIPGTGNASASVNVSSLSGTGGGLLPNINRWRGQLGQAPLSEAAIAQLPTIDAAGTKATLVDISGTDPRTQQPSRLIGVVLPLNGQTWFYKLMGDASVVAQQQEALIRFVQSAKYPAGQ